MLKGAWTVLPCVSVLQSIVESDLAERVCAVVVYLSC